MIEAVAVFSQERHDLVNIESDIFTDTHMGKGALAQPRALVNPRHRHIEP